jgi:hypothetical protein
MAGREKTQGTFDSELPGRLEAFVNNWRAFQGTERAGSQQFLFQLLEIYEVSYEPGTIFEQHPLKMPARGIARAGAQADLFGEEKPQYTAESMDMFLPKVCVWEMKAPSEKKLQDHHEQLLRYWSRARTRYMVLCNFHEFWIYDTNDDNGQLAPKLCFSLDELPARGDALLFLRGDQPDLVGRSEQVTAEIAKMLGRVVREQVTTAENQEEERLRVSKLVLQCVFAMFAEDTELVPPKLFSETMKRAVADEKLDPVLALFADFGKRNQGEKSNAFAPYINGPLFDLTPPRITLSAGQLQDLWSAAKDYDWSGVRPEIFGSIFEQALDPVTRHELGAHFTREADIARVVMPTVIEPWRARIRALKTPKEAEEAIKAMKRYHVLDPACGCGNFLYVVYREMKRLEAALADKWNALQKTVAKRKADYKPAPARPYFTLTQLHGIEIDSFAAFLARVVLWIGEHLAIRELGLDEQTLPLKNLDETIRNADALMTEWPRPDGELAIVGNPPYLGVRKLRRELGDEYVEELFRLHPKNRAADYVTYWFTHALNVLREKERAGFVCTNSIAQNESREASIDLLVERGGTITDAWKSYPWPGEAAVHIGIVNWVMAPFDGIRTLEGKVVSTISPSLTESMDVTAAGTLEANEGLCFMGVTPGNAEFVLTDEQRAEILANDPTSDKVIRPFLIGRDVNREIDQKPTRWIIDFNVMGREEAAQIKGAFRYVQKLVYEAKHAASDRKTQGELDRWWQFVRTRADLRKSLIGKETAIIIPCVAPNLVVTMQPTTVCFDHQLMVIALSDTYHFGLLQSAIHEAWAWARGSTLKGDLRYTNTTIFETFPFPLLPDGRYDPRTVPSSPAAQALAKAASAFESARIETCRKEQLGLTKIHNQLKKGELPALQKAYDAMNDAVCACYGWPAGTWRDAQETVKKLVELNGRVRGGGLGA